jgi:hypothetical protein
MKTTVKISKTSKMPCKSWSLEAIATCPASKGEDGELVDACKGCYATTGFYLMRDAVNLRRYNKEDWKREEWVSEMVYELRKQTYFRWFDSGDVAWLKLAKKIYQVCEQTPHVRHWIPTRMYKFPKFKAILDKLNELPNVRVRFSSDSIEGSFTKEHASTIIPYADSPIEAFICEAYSRGGKCGECRACWHKDVPMIAYVAHGVKINKLIKARAL